MQVLLVGATAHLASTLIPLLLSSPYISHLVLLSRSSIRSARILSNTKITQYLHADLSSLPDSLFTTLRDTHHIRAVIWLVGGSISRFKTLDAAHEANVSLPLAFLEQCVAQGLVPTPAGLGGAEEPCPPPPVEEEQPRPGFKRSRKGRYTDPSAKNPFRFVYMSTYNATQDQFASLWAAGQFRKMKGAAEKSLLGLAEEKGQGMLEVFCLRLGKVLDGGQTAGNAIWQGAGGYISDELVGKKTLSLCLGGRGEAKYGGTEGGGVLELKEVLGDGWAEINSVTVNG
ncbi:hypothetical protein K461DRAFT_290395 [Myriangium duriaei CBS 260.36]|uniref:NAD(P)-binding domain-containing protein n=1 Tax=Myriangium duriaei CBS 260.36 TaxID=1168546 RepID=A0A9P4JDI2_9PEZI|nr:hypothetical protein K461DRAFT_290395 [Myriangium duriaei CBS 260.36]